MYLTSSSEQFLNRKNYIFDLDGTLVDSLGAHEWAFMRTFEKFSLPGKITFNYPDYLGWKTKDVFKHVLPHRDEEEINQLVEAKQECYRSAILEGRVQTFPGAMETLEFLKCHQRSLFIATGGSKKSSHAILKSAGMSEFFEGILTEEDVQFGKPHPDLFLSVLNSLQLQTHDCLTVEDADSGVAASLAAGVDVVLIRSDAHPKGTDYGNRVKSFETFQVFFQSLKRAIEEGKLPP